jgi:hypothetical protein
MSTGGPPAQPPGPLSEPSGGSTKHWPLVVAVVLVVLVGIGALAALAGRGLDGDDEVVTEAPVATEDPAGETRDVGPCTLLDLFGPQFRCARNLARSALRCVKVSTRVRSRSEATTSREWPSTSLPE